MNGPGSAGPDRDLQEGPPTMARHTLTFPVTDPQEILSLRAGDEVTIQGRVVAIRDSTLARIYDQGTVPPLDLAGAFVLHAVPNVRYVGPGHYDATSLGVTTSAPRPRSRGCSPRERSPAAPTGATA